MSTEIFIFVKIVLDIFNGLDYCLFVMANKTLKTLTRTEITNRLINLKVGESFFVSTKAERTRAQHITRTLRDCGRIEHVIASRETDSGFVFFVVPE